MSIGLFLIASTAAEGQGYHNTMSNGTTIRFEADTLWLEYRNGTTKRTILKGETLLVTTHYAGGSLSTATWLLGADSAQLLAGEGSPLAGTRRKERTSSVMLDWDVARLDRLAQTGVDGPTYYYNPRTSPSYSTKARGDTTWVENANGATYRSILHGDTLTVTTQRVGQTPQSKVWLIRGDSAYLLDKNGKSVMSAPKQAVLSMRELVPMDRRPPR